MVTQLTKRGVVAGTGRGECRSRRAPWMRSARRTPAGSRAVTRRPLRASTTFLPEARVTGEVSAFVLARPGAQEWQARVHRHLQRLRPAHWLHAGGHSEAIPASRGSVRIPDVLVRIWAIAGSTPMAPVHLKCHKHCNFHRQLGRPGERLFSTVDGVDHCGQDPGGRGTVSGCAT